MANERGWGTGGECGRRATWTMVRAARVALTMRACSSRVSGPPRRRRRTSPSQSPSCPGRHLYWACWAVEVWHGSIRPLLRTRRPNFLRVGGGGTGGMRDVMTVGGSGLPSWDGALDGNSKSSSQLSAAPAWPGQLGASGDEVIRTVVRHVGWVIGGRHLLGPHYVCRWVRVVGSRAVESSFLGF